MKTQLRIFLLLLLISSTASAQIPNPSFENWTNSFLIDWTINSSPPTLIPVTQSTDAHSGLYAVKGQVVNLSGSPFTPSISATGISGNGFPISQAYSALSGWYKADMIGNDLGFVEVVIYDNAAAVIGTTFGTLPTTAVYQQFTFPISYTGTTQPVSAAIYFSISDPTGGTTGSIGSQFIIDDLSFSPASFINPIEPGSHLSINPNPVSDKLNLGGTFISGQSYNVKVFDIEGKIFLKTIIKSVTDFSLQPLDVSNLSAGNYLVSVSDSKHSMIQRLVIEK
jgi:hypothetical protein